MPTPQTEPIPNFAPPADNTADAAGMGLSAVRTVWPEYMTTEESAHYLRRSVSWMLRQKDIPYYRGKPNLYRRGDLDHWMDETRRYEPMVA